MNDFIEFTNYVNCSKDGPPRSLVDSDGYLNVTYLMLLISLAYVLGPVSVFGIIGNTLAFVMLRALAIVDTLFVLCAFPGVCSVPEYESH